MGSIIESGNGWAVAFAFAAAMVGAWILGWWLGRRHAPEPEDDPGSKFLDASLAILGLLLAFTFAIALGRYDQRRQAVVAESNAIGDFHTCATLLKEPFRSRLQNITREFGEYQLATPFERLPPEDENKAIQYCFDLFACMTDIVGEANEAGTPIAIPLTNTLNNLTSSHASYLAAFEEQLPWPIMLLLLLSAVAPSYLIGNKQGLTRKVHLSGSLSFFVLVTLVIFVTRDLNQPRRGLIRVSHVPMERVVKSLAKP